jgi:aldehyde:ferredoxin oxidoreductase
MFAYHGRYLRIDLERRQAFEVPIAPEVLRAFLGGCGLGTWIVLREGGAEIEAYAAAAPLAFVFSPLVGSPLTTSAKFAVVGKSPLTGRLNDSLASSQFAISGKETGHDAIVIVGACSTPSVLFVDNGRIAVESADALWGLDCRETQERLAVSHPGWATAVIGPAGERQVRFATISHDGRHAGRGGSGGVMGAKRLKAIAVRGSVRPAWARPSELVELSRRISELSFGPATAKYRELGTAANLLAFNRLGVLPTRNFQAGVFEGAEKLAPESIAATRGKARKSCAACTIGCEHLYGVRTEAGGPVRVEYESLFALGPLCGVSEAEAVYQAVKRCDSLGIDTISAGGTIAFAMECVDRGLLDALWLRFGDGSALLRAVEEIGRREGVGDLLSEGSRRAAMAIGPAALRFAPQVKGLEIPGYEPRGLQTMALGFAVGTRGADHNRSSAYEADFSQLANRRNPGRAAAQLSIETEDRSAVMDSLILCKFLRGVFADFYTSAAEMLRPTTGWEVSAEELRSTARRIVNVRKWFNERSGWTPAEDTLPDRFLEGPPSSDSTAVLSRESLDEMIEAYNLARGWTREGYLSDGMTRELSDLASVGIEPTASIRPPA